MLHADGQILDEGVGVDVEPEPRGDLADLLARTGKVETATELRLLVAEHDVLGDGEHGDQHEVLVHHSDARVHRVAGAGEVLNLVVQQDLALVGLVQPVEHIHQCGLAGAVLAQQCVDLARFDREVNVVVCDQGTEPLGDPAKF